MLMNILSLIAMFIRKSSACIRQYFKSRFPNSSFTQFIIRFEGKFGKFSLDFNHSKNNENNANVQSEHFSIDRKSEKDSNNEPDAT